MISVGGEEGFERVHDDGACAGAISVMFNWPLSVIAHFY